MPLPDHTSIQQLAGDFGQFFIKKIEDIRCELDIADHTHSPVSSSCNGHYFIKFRQLTEDEVRKLIMSSKSTTRIKYKLLLFTYKGIHQIAPQYINVLFTRKSTRYRSRLSSVARGIVFVNGNVSGDIFFDDIIYLSVPRTKSVRFEQSSLAVTGPQLWNSLPIDIKMENSLDGFKSKIKTYLFKQAFNV